MVEYIYSTSQYRSTIANGFTFLNAHTNGYKKNAFNWFVTGETGLLRVLRSQITVIKYFVTEKSKNDFRLYVLNFKDISISVSADPTARQNIFQIRERVVFFSKRVFFGVLYLQPYHAFCSVYLQPYRFSRAIRLKYPHTDGK